MGILNKIVRFFRSNNSLPKEVNPVLKILKESGILYDKIELIEEELIDESRLQGWFPSLSITIDKSKNPVPSVPIIAYLTID